MLVRAFGGGLELHRTEPAHAAALAELQTIVFPTLAADQRFTAAHYCKHVELFPEGQLCVLDGDRVVGATTTIRCDDSLASAGHTFAEVIEGGWLTSHDPDGDWLYGADVSVHPEWRGRRIARALYAARQDMVHALGLRGQITVGMPSGYGALKHAMSMQQYYDELVAGTRTDPTISAQRAVGFSLGALVPDYLDDPVCDNYGVVLVLPAAQEVPWP